MGTSERVGQELAPADHVAALDRFEQAPHAPADPGDQVADVRYGFGDRPTY